MKLRHYQEDAANAVLSHVRRCVDPCLIDAPTGSGKSWIIAKIANEIRKASGKKILVLAPSGELVEQDAEKYAATGEKASLFSASVGKKSLRYDVVFGSPLSVINAIERFKGFAAVIIDEAHGLTPTLKKIIADLKKDNEKLRIIGLTATPYRMGSGYIYACHHDRGFIDESESINPYFKNLVYSIDARFLIDEGFLTPPVFDVTAEHYSAAGLELNSRGQFDSKDVERVFTGQGRKTSKIVADVVLKSAGRKGVMLFAATRKHAVEIMESLDPGNSRLVTGETKAKDRKQIIKDFKENKFKYIVSIGTLTTGFDAPHVDVVAILRATESVGLLQQIIGRGLRTEDGKRDCLILDYAENIERHCPHGDVFDPEIKARRKVDSEAMDVDCPDCSHQNIFAARHNPDGYGISDDGYFEDLNGKVIELDEQKLPAHHGRRCTGYGLTLGKVERCEHKWSFKECTECGYENDIAARFCSKCRNELVDPNEKLRIEAAKLAADPYATKVDDCVAIDMRRWPGRDGKPDTLKVDFFTAEKSISAWYAPDSDSAWIRSKWHKFSQGVFGSDIKTIEDALYAVRKAPEKIAYRKKKGSKYLEIVAVEYNSA